MPPNPPGSPRNFPFRPLYMYDPPTRTSPCHSSPCALPPTATSATMGGCATKPKEPNGHLPDENPSAPELLAKSVDIPTSPVPAAEVKVGADGGTAEKETKGETLADVSEPKPEAEPKTEPAAALVGEEPRAPENSLAGLLEAKQDAPEQSVEEIPDDGKKDLPKLDEKEASTDAVEDAGTQEAMVASDAQAEENFEVQKVSAGETTDEVKKLDVQPVVEEGSHTVESAAVSSSSSA